MKNDDEQRYANYLAQQQDNQPEENPLEEVRKIRAEQLAARFGLPCPPLMTGEAVDGLQLELESLGLVYPRDARPGRAKKPRDMQFPDALYLPGEGEDEFSDGAGVR